jgi:hypothetical protein
MYFVIVTDRANLYEGVTVGSISCAVPTQLDSYNVHSNEGKKCAWFRVEGERYANILAEWLAATYPGAEVCVADVASIYQSEKPKVNKKIVSTKGVLPA